MNIFKKILLLGLVALGLGSVAAIAADKATDEAALKAHEQQWFDLYNKGDAAGVANLYSEDGILLPVGEPEHKGRAAIQTYFAKDIAESQKAGLTLKLGAFNGVGVLGDGGWISGNWSSVDKSGATVESGSYLEVCQRSGKGWVIVRDMWNSKRIPAPAAATPAAKPAPK